MLFSMFLSLSLLAQNVISTQGDSYTNSLGSIAFTIAENIELRKLILDLQKRVETLEK